MNIAYADLAAASEVERRVLASKDKSTLKRWLVVQVLRQLVELNKRPPNWLSDVEVNIDFDRNLRHRLLTEDLDYARIRLLLEKTFVDWQVEIAGSPVGRLPFIFRLKPEFQPRSKVLEAPTINPETAVYGKRTRSAFRRELVPCSIIS